MDDKDINNEPKKTMDIKDKIVNNKNDISGKIKNDGQKSIYQPYSLKPRIEGNYPDLSYDLLKNRK